MIKTDKIETKICKVCGSELPSNNIYFNRYQKSKDGLNDKCKSCCRKYNRERYPKYREKSKKNYQENRESRLEYQKEYSIKEKDKIAESKKEYYKKNKKRISLYFNKYYNKNKEYMYKRLKEYREKNKQKLYLLGKEWNIKNKAKRKAITLKRENKIRNNVNTLTEEQWDYIKEYFENRCAYCGRKVRLGKEHFIPVCKNGETSIKNILPSCQSCNSSKGTKNFEEWFNKYEYYNKRREKKILKYIKEGEK